MKIALIGYGRMGRTIEKIATQRGHDIVLRISNSNKEMLQRSSLWEADAAIEFTQPEAAPQHLKTCFAAGTPVVCGTTGWLDQWEEIKAECLRNDGALIQASNFSIGVQLFFELNKKLATLMTNQPQYAAILEEIHHTGKKDAPSGTAISLADQIINISPKYSHWVYGQNAGNDALPITSRRQDPAPGIHRVTYSSPIDEIQITHTAHNREGFALGAVVAAEFLQHKKGIFTMADVLKTEA